MKIVSRPDVTTFGEGDYKLKVTFEQLQLIAAFCYSVRGSMKATEYGQAAYELMEVFEGQIFDDDFCATAWNNVDLIVSIEDDGGELLSQYAKENITFEV